MPEFFTIRSLEDTQHLSFLASLHARAMPDDPWDAAALKRFAAQLGSVLLVAEREGIPLGFLLYRALLDEVEILTLAVDPSQQRQGIARQLLAAMEARHPETRCFLEVAVTNQPAIVLYQQCGFQEIARRTGYYRQGGKPVDAIVMQKG